MQELLDIVLGNDLIVYTLLAFWWLPDEPIGAHDDVVWKRPTTVAGRPALLLYSRFPQHQTLQVVLDEPRADKHRFIVTLEAAGRDLSAGSPLLDDLLARLRFASPQR